MGKGFCRRYFPAINEEPFRVLYSSKRFKTKYTRKMCVLVLSSSKNSLESQMMKLSKTLCWIPRYQYALHTSSFEEQPLSDKTLTRFRKRCYDYESIHGIDLLHECMTGLGTNIAKLMDISPRVKRMDSMMIAANIRKLSRIELLYTCVKSWSSISTKTAAMSLLKEWNIIVIRMTIIKPFITVTIPIQRITWRPF